MADPVSNTPPPGGSDLLARARAALEGVTPGPWEMRDGYVYPLSISARLGGIWPADAEFIAASRELLPELADQLEFMEQEFEAERDRANEHFDARMDAECRVRELTAEVVWLRGRLKTIEAEMNRRLCDD